MPDRKQAITALTMSTLAFTICFAAWMLNGVLVTFLVDNGVFRWTGSEMGTLIGLPVLTGAVLRLPIGILTDRYGGRPVFTGLLVLAAIPMALLGSVGGYWGYFLCSLGFGTIGAGFAVGVAFTSVWFPKSQQGTALGIFGAGNAGAAITTLGAPALLGSLTGGGSNLDAWRLLPRLYAAVLVVTAVVFYATTKNRVPEGAAQRKLGDLVAPLRSTRVWRFGSYYFLVFGGFVALAQWLVPYYTNVYSMSLVTAGLMTSIFSGPSGVIRALGGWLSDRYGARAVTLWVLVVTAVCCALLFFPKMDIESPGRGVIATRAGTVTAVSSASVQVGDVAYELRTQPPGARKAFSDSDVVVMPVIHSWQVPAVAVGDAVTKRQVLARGVTHIYFQANVWIFTALVFAVGIAMGIGKASVYRYIADFFPQNVGVVGGTVGVIGGLGGFFCPAIFGFLLDSIGLWTTTWMLLFATSVACILWLAVAVRAATARHPGEGGEAVPD
ncbi:MAG: NarK/NasA family nitrate transporter [Polyangiaceae bacterium]|nr:NarK/NasA family nitrate transporter [Polyangiaceae bacterium]